MSDYESIRQILRDEISPVKDDVQSIRRTLDGDHSTPGVKVRLDRLEQWKATAMWIVGGVGAVVGGVLSAILTMWNGPR